MTQMPDLAPTDLLRQIQAVIDEPLDERTGHGPSRTDQFARIDALLRDWHPRAEPADPHVVCVEALTEWWTGEATAAEVTGWMNGALQAARLPELDRDRAISMCNMVMADLGDDCDRSAVVSNVLRVAYTAPAAQPRVWTSASASLPASPTTAGGPTCAGKPDDLLLEALREDPEKWSFRALVHIAQLMLRENYPEDVFGSGPLSLDSGAQFTNALREALRQVHAEPEDSASPSEPLTGIFARPDHPRDGWANAHGYVVIAVECDSTDQLGEVRERLQRAPFEGPDGKFYGDGGWLSPWFGGRFDQILTVAGPATATPYGNPVTFGDGRFACIGDQRFAGVFSASEVLAA